MRGFQLVQEATFDVHNCLGLWPAAVTCQRVLNCCLTRNRETPLLLLFARLIIRKHCLAPTKWFTSQPDQIRIVDLLLY